MKDYFSQDSASYAKFRPAYSSALVEAILAHVLGRSRALDLATGNGQFAMLLAPHFEHVEATDMSANQIAAATPFPGITYSVGCAEKIDFPDQTFDLVTVAQGIHWFNFEAFYPELLRVMKPGAIFAAVGYGLLDIGEDLAPLLFHFYDVIVGPYWSPERRYLDDALQTIPFPLEEIPMQLPPMERNWSVESFLGYLGTWSAVTHYRQRTGRDPIEEIAPVLRERWGDRRDVRFPMFIRLGRKPA